MEINLKKLVGILARIREEEELYHISIKEDKNCVEISVYKREHDELYGQTFLDPMFDIKVYDYGISEITFYGYATVKLTISIDALIIFNTILEAIAKALEED